MRIEGQKFSQQTKRLSTKKVALEHPFPFPIPRHRSTVKLWSWQSKSECCHLGSGKWAGKSGKTKAAQSPMSCGRWKSDQRLLVASAATSRWLSIMCAPPNNAMVQEKLRRQRG